MAAGRGFWPSSRRRAVAPRLRPALPVVIAVLAATVSFALSLWYSHSILMPLGEQALTITENSLPGLAHLAEARVELLSIGAQLERARSVDGHESASRQLSSVQQALTSELQRYRGLPESPEEKRLVAELDDQLPRLDAAIDAYLKSAAAAPGFDEQLARVSKLLERLERMNANEALTSANSIMLLRGHAARVALLLGLTSVAIAIVALLMALLVVREQARRMHENAALLAGRSAELEAFSGRVAHDLKDPLSAMVLGVQVARKAADVDARSAQSLERLERQITRMNGIIDGLLEFARSGANPKPDARADLNEVLNEVVSTLHPKAEAANAELRIEPFAPVQVACTPGALGSVMANLVGNAVKYIVESRHAERRINIRVRECADAAHIEIDDNGPGLPLGAERHIFEPFQRLPETKQPGVGLGLATVKKILESYHGRVGVVSRLGNGSTFWFEIPLAPRYQLKPRSHSEEQAGPGEQTGA